MRGMKDARKGIERLLTIVDADLYRKDKWVEKVDKDQVINWVLSFQSFPRKNSDWDTGPFYGFYSSRTFQFSVDENEHVVFPIGGHLASTYCALAILKIVGNDLSNINSEALLISMRRLQQHDGSFMPIHFGAETDPRFVYCAGQTIYT